DQFSFPPGILVRSGDRLTAYWLLEPCVGLEIDGARAEAVLLRLVERFGGDRTLAALHTLLPVPGTGNTLERLNAEPRCSLGQIEKALGVAASSKPADPRAGNPWTRARSAPEFVAISEPEQAWLREPLLARGAITELFSPRGVGKTHIAYSLAVELARK